MKNFIVLGTAILIGAVFVGPFAGQAVFAGGDNSVNMCEQLYNDLVATNAEEAAKYGDSADETIENCSDLREPGVFDMVDSAPLCADLDAEGCLTSAGGGNNSGGNNY